MIRNFFYTQENFKIYLDCLFSKGVRSTKLDRFQQRFVEERYDHHDFEMQEKKIRKRIASLYPA